MRIFGLMASMMGVLIATDPSDDAAKKDLAKFQGIWTLISAERDGKKTPDEDANKIKLTIQGDKYVMRRDSLVVSEGTFKLDPTKKPKEIDETVTAGPNMGMVFQAIYEITDDEHHKICFAVGGKARPTAFSSESSLLQVWKRDKK